MSNTTISHRRTFIRPVHVLLFGLSLIYITLVYRDSVILKPTGHARAELLLISITVAVPEIIIWSIAILSSIKLKIYARIIANSKDGKGMNYLADALILMSVYIVLMSSSYSVKVLFKGSTNLRKVVLLENFLPLSVAFASSVLLALAAWNFNQLVHRKVARRVMILGSLAFVVVMGIFIRQFALTHPRSLREDTIPRFVSSGNTLIYLYILPQIILWALGMYACLYIASYSRNVRGKIYRSMLANLYRGVLIVFVCIFGGQVLILTNFDLSKPSLPLVLVYGLLLLGTLGFSLIYKGAKHLNKIENV